MSDDSFHVTVLGYLMDRAYRSFQASIYLHNPPSLRVGLILLGMGKTVDIDFVLRRVFKKNCFRPLQKEIIQAALEGHDVFVQAATSFGKSLCYQLPAVVDHGITICVSPLLSLMKDQVSQLESSGIRVASLNSTTTLHERDEILEDLCCGHPRTRLLYVTPELCLTESFRRHLGTIYGQGELARVAIDEAHCVSEWGHDFRSSFLRLDFFRNTFPKTPIICLTATATTEVRNDVIQALGLDQARLRVFATTTSRPNLHYDVQYLSDGEDVRFERFLQWIRGVQNRRTTNIHRRADLEAQQKESRSICGIIYMSTRDSCDDLARRLRLDGIGAASYHAGLSPHERVDCQQKWLNNTPGHEIIVATTAFGIYGESILALTGVRGIDKEDVRFVLHWNIPKSFEGFYQEAGRAGRDRKASLCTIFYTREDRLRAEYRITETLEKSLRGHGVESAVRKQALENRLRSFKCLVQYCETVGKCRHSMIQEYFGENQGTTPAMCDFACDHCKDSKDMARRKEMGLGTNE